MADAEIEQLNELFATGEDKLEPDMISELQSIMRMHSLSPQDLWFKWESYSIKMDMDEMKLSMETLRALKRDIQDKLERENRALHRSVKTEKRGVGTPRAKGGGDVLGMLDGMLPSTPGTQKLSRLSASTKKPGQGFETPSMARVRGDVMGSSPDSRASPLNSEKVQDVTHAMPSTSFANRQNPGEVIEILNDHLPSAEPPIAPYSESRIKLAAGSDVKKLAYKPLAMKLSEASETLDDRIDDFIVLVKEHHKLDDSAFGNAASQSTTEIYTVGRIACDSSEGKLNPASLVLETSRRTGAGVRVPLNVTRLPSYQFFPGQIVAFKGINTSGSEFVVLESLLIPLLPNAASSASAISAHRAKLRGDPNAMDDDTDPPPLSILFASGPYTADDNLDFEPLHALCAKAADIYADALVLNGPFIDADHPLIATGDFDLPEGAAVDPDTATMTAVFKYMISPAILRLTAANPAVTVLLVPSVRDTVSKHVSWPQDPFSKKELGLPKVARVIGNPMTLSLNEAVLGISSQDVFWELRHEELVSKQQQQGGLLARLPRYLIEQRSYFPLFPAVDRRKLPTVGGGDRLPTGAMLDTSFLRLGDFVNVRPDVLVSPSALPPFAKVVESVLIINPGHLSKRRGAGTYAKMTLYPPTAGQAGVDDEGGVVSHRVFERARVEITRI